MTKEQTSTIIGAVIALIITVLGVFGYNVIVVQPQLAAIEQTQRQILGVVQAGAGEQGIAGQNVTGFTSLNVTEDAEIGDDLIVGGTTTQGSQSAVTVTTNGTIAVTDDVVPLTAAGSVATATFTGCNTLGKLTYFYNTANQTITITDTGTLKLSGNLALGQYDSFVTVGDGTNCVQVATTNN